MINNSPSFSSPSSAQSFSASSSSPHAPAWAPAESTQHIGMSHTLVDPHFHQPMFTNDFGGSFHHNGVMHSNAPPHMVVQPGMYAARDMNAFWKPSPSGHMIKMEPGADVFAPQLASDFATYPGSQPMISSMSLPTYATHAPHRHFNFSDAESISSVPSPSANSETSARPGSSKRGSKRKQPNDASMDPSSVIGTPEASDAGKSKKTSKQAGQRRPPPSASHVTEAGKPFPVIDTSAKHSSLFVPPDTSGLTKREARLVKNRAAAFLSRQRKREQFEEMEVKCKGISMLVWRMWEAIAGTDAGLESIDSTSLASVLANEDPMARLCLEEVISKKGASIAPTCDENEGTPAPESRAMQRSTTLPTPPTAQKDADSTSAELERISAELAAAQLRESELLSQVDALQASVAAAQSSMTAHAIPVPGFDASMDAHVPHAHLASSMGVPALPFKAMQGAEVPLFVPESPMSKFTLNATPDVSAMLDASHAGFDLSKTPTFAMFSETALRNRSAQQFGNDKTVGAGMGLGLDYRFPCASAPSSPSTASCSSMESYRSRRYSITSNNGSGKAPSTLATVLLIAGMSLMGVGPSANQLPSAEARTAAPKRDMRAVRRLNAKARAAPALSHTAGQPSSHLSDDDLLVEMGLSLSDGEEDIKPSHSRLMSASTISCA